MRRIALCLVCVLVASTVLASCGDDDGAAESTESSTAAASLPASTEDSTPATTEAITTTVTDATTEAETATTTETLPEDMHPVYGDSWAEFWPLPDGSTAVYEITNQGGGDIFDLPARYDHGIEFKDGTWDRFTLGVLEPNNEGVAMYFGSPEPWVVEFAGWEYYRPDGGYTLEWYPDPVRFDLSGAMLEPFAIETVARLEFGGGVNDFGAIFTYYVNGIGQDIEVPLGTLVGARFQVDVSGELMGGDFVFPIEVALVRGHWIVEMINSPAHDRIAIKEPWTG